MTDYEISSLKVGIFQGTASLLVGALAVFLPIIHRKLWDSPNLELSLNSEPFGMHVRWHNGGSARYHHIKVKNTKPTVAKNVGIFCVGLEHATANGDFQFRLVPRVRLFWPYEQTRMVHGMLAIDQPPPRNVLSGDLCDLCFVHKESKTIELSLEAWPTQISEALQSGQPIRLHLKAIADNFESKEPLIVELAWNKKWSESDEEMSRNLVVKAVKPGH